MGASLLLRLLSLDVALMIDFILVNLCKEQIASNKWCSVTTISIRSRRLPRKRLNLIFERCGIRPPFLPLFALNSTPNIRNTIQGVFGFIQLKSSSILTTKPRRDSIPDSLRRRCTPFSCGTLRPRHQDTAPRYASAARARRWPPACLTRPLLAVLHQLRPAPCSGLMATTAAL